MSTLRSSPSSSPVARPSQLSYYPSADNPHHHRNNNNSTRSINRRSSASSDRSSNHYRNIVPNSGAGGGSGGSSSYTRSTATLSAPAPAPVLASATTSASASAPAFSNSPLASPASPTARPKRARASPDPIPSPHPAHREFNSPRTLPASQSGPHAISLTSSSVHDSTVASSDARAPFSSVNPRYVNVGTQYTPPDYPPTSIRSSLHPANRAAAARAAATALLHELSSSASSSLSSSSSADDTHTHHQQHNNNPSSRPGQQSTAAPTAAGASLASQSVHPSRTTAEPRGAAAAVDVASSGRVATPPNEAEPPLGAAPAEPQLRVTPQAPSSAAQNVTSAVPAGTATAAAARASAAGLGQESSSLSTHRLATAAPRNQGSTRSSSAQTATSQTADTDGRVQLLPAEYSRCDASILARLIADMLMELIRFNDQIPLQDGHLTRFHSRAPPSISVHDYLARLTFHATLPPPILLSMVFLIDKLCLLYPAFTINSLTVHRFLITAATVASKGLSDSFWTNQTYARCGGVTVRELAMLEIELLSRIQWRIVPRPEALFDYYVNLVARNPAFEIEQAQRPSPQDDNGSEMDVDDHRST